MIMPGIGRTPAHIDECLFLGSIESIQDDFDIRLAEPRRGGLEAAYLLD